MFKVTSVNLELQELSVYDSTDNSISAVGVSDFYEVAIKGKGTFEISNIEIKDDGIHIHIEDKEYLATEERVVEEQMEVQPEVQPEVQSGVQPEEVQPEEVQSEVVERVIEDIPVMVEEEADNTLKNICKNFEIQDNVENTAEVKANGVSKAESEEPEAESEIEEETYTPEDNSEVEEEYYEEEVADLSGIAGRYEEEKEVSPKAEDFKAKNIIYTRDFRYDGEMYTCIISVDSLKELTEYSAFILDKTCTDFMYFCGDDVEIFMPQVCLSDYKFKDAVLKAVDDALIGKFINSYGEPVSLFKVCTHQENTLAIYQPFSDELGVSSTTEIYVTVKKRDN